MSVDNDNDLSTILLKPNPLIRHVQPATGQQHGLLTFVLAERYLELGDLPPRSND